MKKITLFVSLITMLMAGAVQAHGPVRGKMTAIVTFNASAEDVWAVVKDYDNMSWHPMIDSTEATKGNNKGSVRTLTLKNGGTITEKLKDYKEDKMSYKYKITEMSSTGTIQHAGQDEEIPVLPVENYAATLNVNQKGDETEIKWIATYYRAYVNNNPPEELNEEAADKAVTAVLTEGLANIAKKFDSGIDTSDVEIKIKR